MPWAHDPQKSKPGGGEGLRRQLVANFCPRAETRAPPGWCTAAAIAARANVAARFPCLVMRFYEDYRLPRTEPA